MHFGSFLQFVGPKQTAEFFGVRLVGVNGENGKKLLFSVVFVLVVYYLGASLRWLAQKLVSTTGVGKRLAFWSRQGISILSAILVVVGLISLWFDNPARLATAVGLVAAGLAFALQRVVTAFAGYVVILRGKTFSVGDRIMMGGIRGDVIELNFLQTVIMEMGQPAQGDASDPMWVQARQYTGRIVHISNAQLFDEPVYNYTREFPYIWEEMRVPVPYTADRSRAEEILLNAARQHTTEIATLGEGALEALERRFVMNRSELHPEVYWRLTDNWVELTVRFLVPDAGIRPIKSAMSRQILADFEAAGIQIASSTLDISALPPIEIHTPVSSASFAGKSGA